MLGRKAAGSKANELGDHDLADNQEFLFIQSRTFGGRLSARSPKATIGSDGRASRNKVTSMNDSRYHGSSWLDT